MNRITSSAAPGHGRRYVRDVAATHRGWLPALLLLILSAVACSSGTPSEPPVSAEGVIVDVQGTLTRVERFELLLPDGSRLDLRPEPGVLERAGFSPAHLREHAALGQPVAVTYEVVDGQNAVTAISDAVAAVPRSP